MVESADAHTKSFKTSTGTGSHKILHCKDLHSGPADKQKRQTIYVEALNTLLDFRIYYGKYQNIPRQCNL